MDFKKQEETAKKELKQEAKSLLKERRHTRLIRISCRWHKKLKDMSKADKTTMSKTLDHVCKYFYKNYPRDS